MKIAYLTNQYPKISHTFIRREIEAVEDQGVSVLRCSIRPCPDQLIDEADLRELERTHVLLADGFRRWGWRLLGSTLWLALSRPGRFAAAMRCAVRLAWRCDQGWCRHLAYLAEACVLTRMIERESCVHVHAHFGSNPASVALLGSILGGYTYSFTVHGAPTLDRLVTAGVAEKVRGAAFTVAISHYNRAQLMRYADSADHARIHVVRCGLDPSFRDRQTQAPSASRRLVCVARLAINKGLPVLVDATARLVDAGESLEVVLVGDGPLRPQLERAIEAHGLESHVRLTGWASSDEVRRWMSDARALVLPSFIEGLPVVIMEAMALRRPVISTATHGMPELVVPGETGWLVPVGAVDALSEAMRAVLHAPADQLERMGENAVRRVWAQHNVQCEAGKLVRLMRTAGGTRELQRVEEPWGNDPQGPAHEQAGSVQRIDAGGA